MYPDIGKCHQEGHDSPGGEPQVECKRFLLHGMVVSVERNKRVSTENSNHDTSPVPCLVPITPPLSDAGIWKAPVG